MKVWFPAIRTGSGSDVFTLQLAQGLRQHGIETVVTWFPHRLEFAPDLMRVVHAPPGTDLIHVNSWAGFAFHRSGIPLVVTAHHCVHDPDYAPYRSFLQAAYHASVIRQYERRSFAAASVVTAVSAFTARRVAECFPGTAPIVIHNGIDTEFFRPVDDVQAPTDRPFRLLFVGNPTRRKGFDIVLAVMAQLDPQRFTLEYTVGLRGGAVINRPGVHCLGRVDRPRLLRAYQDCDALLFPSRYEGFGYAAGEAMACGKPVVAADRLFAHELVKHGETGMLCPVDDVDAFVDAVRQLAGNRELAKKMGNAGHRRVMGDFTRAAMVGKYTQLYCNLLFANRA